MVILRLYFAFLLFYIGEKRIARVTVSKFLHRKSLITSQSYFSSINKIYFVQ